MEDENYYSGEIMREKQRRVALGVVARDERARGRVKSREGNLALAKEVAPGSRKATGTNSHSMTNKR